MPRAFQGRNERGAPVDPAKPARFTIDSCHTTPGDWDSPLTEFAGYTRGQYWNGWACPYFPRESADLLLAAQLALIAVERADPKRGDDPVGSFVYDPARDAYVDTNPEYPDEPDVYAGEDLVTTEGVKRVYPVGAFSWTWDEVEDATERCACSGTDIDCGRSAVKNGLCSECLDGSCGHKHSAIGRKKKGPAIADLERFRAKAKSLGARLTTIEPLSDRKEDSPFRAWSSSVRGGCGEDGCRCSPGLWVSASQGRDGSTAHFGRDFKRGGPGIWNELDQKNWRSLIRATGAEAVA